jgi:hypothetical protein
MRRSRFTKITGALTGLLAGLVVASLAIPVSAETVRETHPYYDMSKEVTLTGTVASVLTKVAGTIPGPHITLTTISGSVDASLGKWGLVGKDAPSLKGGEQIELTGVMKTLKDKQVFIVRIVKSNGHLYSVRNEHGVAISPEGRVHASQTAAQKGESL